MAIAYRRSRPKHGTKHFIVLGTCVAVLLGAAPCSQSNQPSSQPESTVSQKPIEQVLREQTPSLMKIPGVVGVGQALCADEPCIRIYLAQRTPDIERRIPRRIEGYPTSLEVTGLIRATP